MQSPYHHNARFMLLVAVAVSRRAMSVPRTRNRFCKNNHQETPQHVSHTLGFPKLIKAPISSYSASISRTYSETLGKTVGQIEPGFSEILGELQHRERGCKIWRERDPRPKSCFRIPESRLLPSPGKQILQLRKVSVSIWLRVSSYFTVRFHVPLIFARCGLRRSCDMLYKIL